MAIKKIYNENKFEHRYKNDVERIQKVCLKNGYDADLNDCANIWEDYSDMFAANWLFLPKDDSELWEIIENKVEQISKNN